MDKFVGAAKDFLDKDNDKDDKAQDQRYHEKPSGGYSGFLGDVDFDKAKEEADKQSGSSGNASLFANAIGSLLQKKDKLDKDDIDEQDAINKHKKTYESDDDDDNDEKSIGTAAAMQALKLFNRGEGSSSSQSAYLGLAMSEASKLFDNKASKGKVSSSTTKDAAVEKAGEVALKMFLKSQGDKQENGLLGLASKFMK